MQQKSYDVKEKEEKELESISYLTISNEFKNFNGDSLREWKFYENIRLLAKLAFQEQKRISQTMLKKWDKETQEIYYAGKGPEEEISAVIGGAITVRLPFGRCKRKDMPIFLERYLIPLDTSMYHLGKSFEFLLKGVMVSAFGEEQFDRWIKENKKKGHHLEFLFNEFLTMFEKSISNRENRDERFRCFWSSISADTKEDVEERLNCIYEAICRITDSVPVARSFKEEDRDSVINLEAYLGSKDKKLKKLRDVLQTLDQCKFNTNPYSVDGILILNIYAAAIYLVLLSDVLMNGRTECFYYLIDGLSSHSEMKPLEAHVQEARDYLYLEE
ncbi:MAG: hypothetical protein OXC18_23435 [Desulfurellaceae bacterium]|nr:hypothetical protein [Desulfurellaceae bacterium]